MKKIQLVLLAMLALSFVHAGSLTSALRISGTGHITGLPEKEYPISENIDKTFDNKKWDFNCYSVQRSDKLFYCVAAMNLSYLDLTKKSAIKEKLAISTDLTANFISIYNLNLKMDNDNYKQTGTYYLGYQFKEVKYPVKAGFLSRTQNYFTAYYPYPGKQDTTGQFTLNQFGEDKLTETQESSTVAPTKRIQTESELLFSIDRIIGKQYDGNDLTKAFKRELDRVRELKFNDNTKDAQELDTERDYNEYNKLTSTKKNNNFYFELTNEVSNKKIKLYPLIATLQINTTARISLVDKAGGDSYVNPIIYGKTIYPLRISFILKTS